MRPQIRLGFDSEKQTSEIDEVDQYASESHTNLDFCIHLHSPSANSRLVSRLFAQLVAMDKIKSKIQDFKDPQG